MESWCVSLQELSFEVIIKNFSRFTTVSSTTVDERLKKNFLFLQRVYSQKLLDELTEREKLKEDHLNFLLNTYLRKIDVACLLHCSSKENIIDKVLPISHSLSELTCTGECLENDCVKALIALLPHLVNVTKLSIPNVCNDEMLKIITSSCPHLTDLDIQDSSVTSLGVQTLYTDPGGTVQVSCPLTNLNLLNTDVTHEDVGNILKNITTMEELIFNGVPYALYSLHKADLDNNTLNEIKKYNLTNLTFCGYYEDSPLDELLKLCAELCPRVKKLCINLTITDDFQLCCLFKELESIIVHSHIEEYALDLNSFIKARGGKLKELDATGCSLSVSTLIQNCPNLVSIVLTDCNYMQLDKNIVNKLCYLQKLDFDLIDIFESHHGEVSLEMLLSASPNLKSLQLVNSNFSDSEIFHKLTTYFTNCSLNHLSFSSSDIEFDSLEQMVLSCCRLQSLSLDGCENINVYDIERLNSHTFDAFNRKIKIDFINYDDEDSDFDYDFEQEAYDIYDAYDVYEDAYNDYGGHDYDDDYYDDSDNEYPYDW